MYVRTYEGRYVIPLLVRRKESCSKFTKLVCSQSIMSRCSLFFFREVKDHLRSPERNSKPTKESYVNNWMFLGHDGIFTSIMIRPPFNHSFTSEMGFSGDWYQIQCLLKEILCYCIPLFMGVQYYFTVFLFDLIHLAGGKCKSVLLGRKTRCNSVADEN